MSVCYRRFDANGKNYVSRDPERMFPDWNTLGEMVWKVHEGEFGGHVGGIWLLENVLTEGNFPVKWVDDECVLVKQDDLGPLDLYDTLTGQHLGKVPAEHRSEGIFGLDAEGHPIMGGGVIVELDTNIGKVKLWDASQDAQGNWTGTGDGGGEFGSVNLVEANGEAWMWVAPGPVLYPPRVFNGRVCISADFETPAPDDIIWQPFKRYEPPLLVPANPRAAIRMGYGTPALPSANVTIPCDGAPFLGGLSGPHGIVLLPRQNDDPTPDRVQVAIARARETGWPIGFYDDNYALALCRPEWDALPPDVGKLWLQQVYPRPRLADDIANFPAELSPRLFVETCRRTYPLATLTEADTIINQAVESGQGFGVLYFGAHQSTPEFRAHIDAYCKATPAPDLSVLPKTVKPLPPVTPPPVVTPEPPVVGKPTHGHISPNADPPVVKKKPKRGTLG